MSLSLKDFEIMAPVGSRESLAAAIQAGAAAAVIYNNAPGSINMNLTGYNFPNPAVMIEQSKAKEILAASTQDETTGLWGGKMTVSAKAETLHGVADGYKPSSFSSWGTTENLDLKPELMTPGGNIYSTLNHSSYGMMSGTSMAAPSAAGGAANRRVSYSDGWDIKMSAT